MIKECKVLSWNEIVMVVEFDGEKLQLPSTKVNQKLVYVKHENKRYSLVSKEDFDKSNRKKKVVVSDETIEN